MAKTLNMKKYIVKWGDWDCFQVEVPAMDISQAIELATKKHNIRTGINSVICLGNW